MKDLPKTYNPKEVEGKIYAKWEKSAAFRPSTDLQPHFSKLKSFCIVIPPPNVTGSLHMGHALNNIIQDILIRRARMQGKPTLWVPGTDHAGIATQNVVEKELAKEGKTRQDLGREKFVKRVWQWVDKYGHIIIDQLKKLGCSCDWSRQRFTMDKDYTKAVETAFKHYYDKGWIYQGERVINWCPRCQTALSDIEVEHINQKTKLYYFKYDKSFPITIATTRPETKLGDTAVAVNPNDKRYQKFIGKTFKVNFVGVKRKIKVISESEIDMKFGTGAVGITPAHSLVDYEIAEKNGLPLIKIIDQNGRMTSDAGKEFEGNKTVEARAKIIEKLKDADLLDKEEEIENALSICYRCDKPIEPQPSKQWFLKMEELVKPAIEAVEKGEIKFVPERWKKVYLDWMKNLKDWCISRQIWWGHKIPIESSEDVLDTWFSSALWPFATLGWPEKTADLKYFYPTTTLSTARDIIYLWVARMIFSGYEFMAQKPFETVYIHPTILTLEGRRMSKSLGTGVDPLALIEKYGADAVRFGLAYINTGIQDIKFDEKAILAGRKFANKIWNIARFIIMKLESSNIKAQMSNEIKNPKPKTETDKKIIEALQKIIKSTDHHLDHFRFGQAAHELYNFVWHNFADIYLEKSKIQMSNVKLRKNTLKILFYTLINSLKLLHPFMPFITEEIWGKLEQKELLIVSSWPKFLD